MDALDILRLAGLLGGVGVVVAILRKLGLLGGSSSAGTGLGQGLDRASREARRRESEARQRREAADDAAREEIDNRSHTDDPLGDLNERLYGDRDGPDGAA